jgi:hypothetical protein
MGSGADCGFVDDESLRPEKDVWFQRVICDIREFGFCVIPAQAGIRRAHNWIPALSSIHNLLLCFLDLASGDSQQRIDQSGAFQARTGRQILGRWREPPVDQNNEQKGPEGRQNKSIGRPVRPGCDF